MNINFKLHQYIETTSQNIGQNSRIFIQSVDIIIFNVELSDCYVVALAVSAQNVGCGRIKHYI